MKKGRLIKMLLLLLAAGLASTSTALCCSMFKITMHGKTMVGNNEDYWNPNARIWFEQGGKGKYGAAYVGFDNFWPQGGINQAGLVFDGFSQDFLAIRDTTGKKPLSMNFLKDIMKSCATVDQVKSYLSQYSLAGLESSSFFFVDKSGRYLSVDGDSLLTGNKEWYIASNFHPSQVKQECDVPISFYQKGRKYLENHRDTSASFCVSVMDSMRQKTEWGAGTIYTTIYDLNSGSIYLYFLQDYSHPVKFNLNKELLKGDSALVVPDLFPDNISAQKFINCYNSVSNQLELLKDEDIMCDSTRYALVSNTLLKKDIRLIRTFSNRINGIANSWMSKENYNAAIKVFKICILLTPNSWIAYDSLATAYMKNNENELAIKNFEKSVALNPDNLNGKLQIDRLRKNK